MTVGSEEVVGSVAPDERESRRRVTPLTMAVVGFVVCLLVAGLVARAVIPAKSLEAAPRPASAVDSGDAPAVGAGLPTLGRGKLAPGFTLPRIGGGPEVSLAAYRGRPVVLNFFASWCPDCTAELRALAEVSSASGAVQFIGIDTNDTDPGKAQAQLRAAGGDYPVGEDPGAVVANGSYLVQALPVTIFVRSDGRIAGQVFGAQTVASLTPWVRALSR
jgi:thiol-disulfide isomerase/thioredoxin